MTKCLIFPPNFVDIKNKKVLLDCFNKSTAFLVDM